MFPTQCAANGSGAGYAANGSSTITMGSTGVVLYARWLTAPCSLDVDGNNAIDALIDGLLMIRAMLG